jgi:hypothetical protein
MISAQLSTGYSNDLATAEDPNGITIKDTASKKMIIFFRPVMLTLLQLTP